MSQIKINNDMELMLKRLFLFHTLRNFHEFIKQAETENLGHKAFLKLVLESELASRHKNTVARLIRKARFPATKTIDSFDFNHPTRISKAFILNTFSMDFVNNKEHLIFLGPGGVGKSHLASAIGYACLCGLARRQAACQREIKTLFTTAADMINRLVASKSDYGLERALIKYCAPRLLVIDELGYIPMDKEGRDLFFQVISKRADTGSMIITTNKAFKDWPEIFQDNAVATAIAERLTEHGELIKIEGSSYRVKKRRQKRLGL